MRTPRIAGVAPALLLLLATPGPGGVRAASDAAAPLPAPAAATLEPGEIRVGDPARLTVTFEHAAGAAVELPELERGRAVVVTGRRRETEALAGGAARTTFTVGLTSFEVGAHGVGGLPGLALRVRSVLPDGEAPLRGPKEPVRWPAPRRPWVALAMGLLAVSAAVYVVVRRAPALRRRKSAIAPAAPSPEETALRALAALCAASLPEPAVEPYYRELSAIVRRYLEERFGLRAPERTTEEFIREAARSGALSPPHQALVETFLEQCDLVKFARRRPPREEAAAAAAAAERLVRETRPPRVQDAGERRKGGR